MRKTTARPRRKDRQPDTVAGYLARLPRDVRAAMRKLRRDIGAAAPEAVETIAWGMPAFRQGRLLVGYAAFKNHCSLFPMSGTVIAQNAGLLKGFTTTKGAIHFTVEKPLPARLVRRIVRARIAENRAGQARRSRWMAGSPPRDHPA